MPVYKPNDPETFPARGTPGGFRDWWDDADPDVAALAQAQHDAEQRLAQILAADPQKTQSADRAREAAIRAQHKQEQELGEQER
jgi:hypothetical protein